MAKYSVLLPTYEEKENLPLIMWLIFQEADKQNLDLEVVVVDDNSPDGTQDVVKKLQQIYPGRIVSSTSETPCETR